MSNKEIAIKILEAKKGAYEHLRSVFYDSDQTHKDYDYEIKLEVVNELLEEFKIFLQDEES